MNLLEIAQYVGGAAGVAAGPWLAKAVVGGLRALTRIEGKLDAQGEKLDQHSENLVRLTVRVESIESMQAEITPPRPRLQSHH